MEGLVPLVYKLLLSGSATKSIDSELAQNPAFTNGYINTTITILAIEIKATLVKSKLHL